MNQKIKDEVMKDRLKLTEYAKYLVQINDLLIPYQNSKRLKADLFFKISLADEIAHNSLSICLNLLYDNFDSPGIDSCCRSIIESLIIYLLDKFGWIGKKNKEMYKYQYASVIIDNSKNFTNPTGHSFYYSDSLKEDRKKYISLATAFHKCNEKDPDFLKACKEPYFCLVNNLKTQLDIGSIVRSYMPKNKQPQDIKDLLQLHSFFSIWIHPHHLDSTPYNDAIESKHWANIVKVIKLAYNLLLQNFGEYQMDEPGSFRYTIRPEMSVFKLSDDINRIVEYALGSLHDEIDMHLKYYYRQTCALLKDMLLCYSVAFINDMVIAKYKSLFENFSLIYYFVVTQDREERWCAQEGMECATLIQCCKYIKLDSQADFKKQMLNRLQPICDKFYKRIDNNEDVESLYKHLSNKTLYSLGKDIDFRDITDYMVHDIIYPDLGWNLKALYDLSLDMEHGGGFNFSHEDINLNCFAVNSIGHAYFMFSGAIVSLRKIFDCDTDIINKINTYLNNMIHNIVSLSSGHSFPKCGDPCLNFIDPSDY